MEAREARFQIGQVVRHRLHPFRGVIFDIDPSFNNTEEWWLSIPEERRGSRLGGLGVSRNTSFKPSWSVTK